MDRTELPLPPEIWAGAPVRTTSARATVPGREETMRMAITEFFAGIAVADGPVRCGRLL
jgi:hypothetical protein